MATVSNFKLVGPDARSKLAPLMKHYAKFPHPFTKCVQDNRKRFGADAEKVCAVLKDLIRGTTKWRKGAKNLSLVELREVVDMADASGIDCANLKEARRVLELAEQSGGDGVDFTLPRGFGVSFTDLSVFTPVFDMARPGLVQAEIQVKSSSGKMFTRKIWVRPKQAKAMKAQKGGATLSKQGLKVTAEQTAVLNELAKIPKEQRPKGWQTLVKALVDPRHGGRLGPQKRKLLHEVAKQSPAGSPLRTAAAGALAADVPKGRKKKATKRKADAKKAGAIRGAAGKVLTQAQLVAAGKAQAAKKTAKAEIKSFNKLPEKERIARAKSGQLPKLPKGTVVYEDASIGPGRKGAPVNPFRKKKR